MRLVGFDSKDTFKKFVRWIKDTFSQAGHKHSTDDLTSGTLPLTRGGTGAVTASGARTTLDAAPADGASNRVYDAEQAITEMAADMGTVPDGKTLQGEIETLQDSVSGTFTSASVTTQTGFALRGGTYVKRHGIIGISLGINVNESISKNSQVAVGTITNADLRPIADADVLISPFGVSSGGVILFASMQSNGAIYIRPMLADLPSGNFVWIRTTYLTSV